MNVEQTARLEQRVVVHRALADPTRLRIVDRLGLTDESPSELGAALEMSSNLLAHHVNVLAGAGIVVRRRSEGDTRRTYLSLSRTGLALATDNGSRALTRPRRILFVCTANTARSHLAAALWRRASTVRTASAGTHPGERINPAALSTAERHGLALPDIAPRLLSRTLREGDLVVTVCDRAHEELSGADWAHWSIPDPVLKGDTAHFEEAFSAISARVNDLAPRMPAS